MGVTRFLKFISVSFLAFRISFISFVNSNYLPTPPNRAAYRAAVNAFKASSIAVSTLYALGAKAILPSTNVNEVWYNPRNERIYDTRRQSYLSTNSVAPAFAAWEKHSQRLVVIGEIHSNPCHHRVEFDVIKAFFNANKNTALSGRSPSIPEFAIGLECFYRQHQAALDRFIFEHHNFKTLKDETNWESSWGYDLNYYAKIFNFASQNRIRLLGLNIPYPIAKYVGSVGLENLPPKVKAVLPAEIDTNNQKHRALFDEAILGSYSHSSPEFTSSWSSSSSSSSSPNRAQERSALDKMYLVQCLWEDYMAESCSMYLNRNPSSKLCVIAGVGHVKGRLGIPNRITKRTGTIPFVIVPEQVDWLPDTGLPDIIAPLSENECDWAWYTEPEIAV